MKLAILEENEAVGEPSRLNNIISIYHLLRMLWVTLENIWSDKKILDIPI